LRGGIRTVLIPEENRKDLADLPKTVTQKLKIVPVSWIDEVLDLALERPIAPADAESKRESAAHDAEKSATPLAVDELKH